MSLVNEQDAFLDDVAKLLVKIKELGFQRSAGEMFRTVEQQEIYVKTGRSQTKNSMHLKRLAIDLNFFKNGKLIYDVATLKPIGDYWESLSPRNRWGGNWKTFKDVPHFERYIP
jgi:hypothetical protein